MQFMKNYRKIYVFLTHHCEKAEDYEALIPWNIDLVTVTTKDQ